jgi:4-aminobutyrate aminotransferase/(S)-3-amino-2-methylpropionate transaminase
VIVDVDGNSLIDLGSGIAVVNVGNAAPGVVAAVTDQTAAFTHTCFMVTPYEGYVAVCEELARLTSRLVREALGTVQLGRGGGRERREDRAARDRRVGGRGLRPRLPRAHQPHDGADGQGDALQDRLRAVRRRGLPGADVVPVPRAGADHGSAGGRPGDRRYREAGRCDQVACVVVEPIQGEGGFVVPAPGFLPAVAEWCRARGVLFVADEIQTGFGRTGDLFACDHEGVEPDLVTTAKGIAGGSPSQPSPVGPR